MLDPLLGIPLPGPDPKLVELHRRAVEMIPAVEREIVHAAGGRMLLCSRYGRPWQHSLDAIRTALWHTCEAFIRRNSPAEHFTEEIRSQLWDWSRVIRPQSPKPQNTRNLHQVEPARPSGSPAADFHDEIAFP